MTHITPSLIFRMDGRKESFRHDITYRPTIPLPYYITIDVDCIVVAYMYVPDNDNKKQNMSFLPSNAYAYTNFPGDGSREFQDYMQHTNPLLYVDFFRRIPPSCPRIKGHVVVTNLTPWHCICIKPDPHLNNERVMHKKLTLIIVAS